MKQSTNISINLGQLQSDLEQTKRLAKQAGANRRKAEEVRDRAVKFEQQAVEAVGKAKESLLQAHRAVQEG